MGGSVDVCVIAHAHPALSRGGGEMAAWREVRALRAAGRTAVLIAAAEQPPAEWPALPEGESLYDAAAMEEDRLAWAEDPARRALLSRLLATGAGVFHLHHLWRVGLDLVAALRAARPEARLVLTLHEMLAICANHGQMVRTADGALCAAAAPEACAACFPGRAPAHFALRRAAFLRALSLFDAVVFPSDFLRRRYAEWGFVPRAGFVVENPLDPALAARPRRPPAPDLAARFAFFGQPTPFKGLDVLLSALRLAREERPGIALDVHGCGAEEVVGMFPALAPLLSQLGGAVRFRGRYHPTEVLDRMAEAGWVVVPSVWWENSPMVILEAKRAGVPLIVSGIGGMAEKVRPGLDGLHATPGSARDLARVLAEAADPALHARIARSLADAPSPQDFLDALGPVLGPGRG
ncbi:MAG: glycosyltransferase [Acetobacteraceae bacterium]|nr:glycosyltransferase [Acetobacteraceae bacterium]